MNPAPAAASGAGRRDAGGASLRLFIGLWPPPPARQALADWMARWHWPAAAATVPPDQLHVTLHFLGTVEAARCGPLSHALRGLHWPPFQFTLEAAHPRHWGQGLVVLEPPATARPPEAMAALHAALAEVLRAQGLPVENRPWRPHLTLSRRAEGARPPAETPAVALRWTVRDFALVESGGGRYRTLERFAAA